MLFILEEIQFQEVWRMFFEGLLEYCLQSQRFLHVWVCTYSYFVCTAFDSQDELGCVVFLHYKNIKDLS